jgi:hypothetical protein
MLNSESFENTINNSKIINEKMLDESCYFNNNELFNGKKVIIKLDNNQLYTTCDYGKPINGSCKFSSCNNALCDNTNKVKIVNDKNNVSRCREEYQLL